MSESIYTKQTFTAQPNPIGSFLLLKLPPPGRAGDYVMCLFSSQFPVAACCFVAGCGCTAVSTIQHVWGYLVRSHNRVLNGLHSCYSLRAIELRGSKHKNTLKPQKHPQSSTNNLKGNRTKTKTHPKTTSNPRQKQKHKQKREEKTRSFLSKSHHPTSRPDSAVTRTRTAMATGNEGTQSSFLWTKTTNLQK